MPYYKNEKECPFRLNCKDNCEEYCRKFNNINKEFEKADIPKRYGQPIELESETIDYRAFADLASINRDTINFIGSGNNLFINGSNRKIGKTNWAVKIMQNFINNTWDISYMRVSCKFIYVPDFLFNLKNSFTEKDEQMQQLEKQLKTVNLLILDGIDEIKLSEWEQNYLYILFKFRLNEQLSTIITGRNNSYKLENMLGENLASYILENCRVITLKGKTYNPNKDEEDTKIW